MVGDDGVANEYEIENIGKTMLRRTCCACYHPYFLSLELRHADDDDDDNNGLPAYFHQVGLCHDDEDWEYDTVTFPPCIIYDLSSIYR